MMAFAFLVFIKNTARTCRIPSFCLVIKLSVDPSLKYKVQVLIHNVLSLEAKYTAMCNGGR